MTVLVSAQHEALDGMFCIRSLAALPELMHHLA